MSGRSRRLLATLSEITGAGAACQAVAAHLAEDARLMPSLYLEEGGRLRCQAVHGYWQVLDGIPPSAGVIGLTFRTGEPVMILDIATSAEYLAAVPGVRAEICVPVLTGARVVGVINVESREALEAGLADEMRVCARLLGERLGSLGGAPSPSAAQLLARHAAHLAGLVEVEAVERAAVAAALDVSAMDTAMIATAEPNGPLNVRHASGALAGALLSVEQPALERMSAWVRAGTSCYTVGEAGGVGFMGVDRLREAGVETLIVLPLAGRDSPSGLLVLARREVARLETREMELLELLAAQVASCLRTAAAVSELRERAARDPLTGLGHRATFGDALAGARAAQGDGLVPAVLMIDVDGFKAINDTRGHACGDGVLRDIARVLSGALRSGDRLFRLGGDEFAGLVHVRTEEEALDVGRRLAAAARTQVQVSVSIGVALTRADESDAALLERADSALYTVKRDGRNGVAKAAPGHPEAGPGS